VPTRLLEPETARAPRTQEPLAEPVRILDRFLDTTPELHLTLCRLVLGGVMFAHSTQKLLGWFGGAGFMNTIEGFRDQLGLPLIVGVLVVFAEFVGSIGLILGFVGRAAAACIVTVMVGAVLLVHMEYGFFMNWFGANGGEGFEYHLLAIGLAIPILARGSGAASFDWWLLRQMRKDRRDMA
jgi:putative oxidoreductase